MPYLIANSQSRYRSPGTFKPAPRVRFALADDRVGDELGSGYGSEDPCLLQFAPPAVDSGISFKRSF